jgi:hypothetical protein
VAAGVETWCCCMHWDQQEWDQRETQDMEKEPLENIGGRMTWGLSLLCQHHYNGCGWWWCPLFGGLWCMFSFPPKQSSVVLMAAKGQRSISYKLVYAVCIHVGECRVECEAQQPCK